MGATNNRRSCGAVVRVVIADDEACFERASLSCSRGSGSTSLRRPRRRTSCFAPWRSGAGRRDHRYPHAAERTKGSWPPRRSVNDFAEVGVLVFPTISTCGSRFDFSRAIPRASAICSRNGSRISPSSPTRSTESSRTSGCRSDDRERFMQRRREPDTLAPLSGRELEVLALIAEGRSIRGMPGSCRDRQDGRGPYSKRLR